MLAVGAFGASLIAGVLVGAKRETPEFWTVRPALFWFSTVGWEQHCSNTLESTGKPESAFVTGLLVARKREVPESWAVVWQYCSAAPERTGKSDGVLTARIRVRAP
jgi:hypothetical protein